MSDATHPVLPDTLEGVTAEIDTIQAALVESLQDVLLCAICGCVFIDPRVLRCQHCFCLRCLYSTVARDRMPQLEVPCAYRCEESTVAKGDIRTLPKNHCITNTCVLLRQHLVRRAQLLEKKFTLLREDAAWPHGLELNSSTPASANPSSQVMATPIEAASLTRTHTADALLRKKEKDLVAELYECEWCSCSSSSCEVCPYCWSRVCAECRGQFSDHQFLCVEPHQPGRRPPEGWLPGTTPSGVAALTTAAVDSGATAQPHSLPSPAEEGGEDFADPHNAVFPFLFTPFFIPTLVKECLVKQHHAPLQLSEVDVTNITPLRLSVPECAVQCQHHTTGFSFDYIMHPTFSLADGVVVDINTHHWTESDGKPSSTLSFLANATRLGEVVLQDLHKLSTATSDVVLELSSAAHQAYVRRNKGLHLYALHVWVLARAQCQVARDALLPHLERSRLLENIMGDLVTYRFQQTMGRASPPQKHVIRDRCMAFLKTEIELCRQLDQVMEGIDAACRGIYALLGRMRDAMKELSTPKVHRGEEHKKSRQSRLRFSVQLFHPRDEQQQQHQDSPGYGLNEEEEEYAAAAANTQTRAKPVRSTAAARNNAPSIPFSTAAPSDPALSEAAVSESSFRGQISEHHSTTQALTDSLISLLRCFMQARVWEWSLCNTCIRECGLGEEDRRVLLEAEKTLQLLTDELLRGIWRSGRLVYILEVHQDRRGPASSLDILMDKETLALLDAGTENPIYEHNEVFEGLKALSQLRNHLLNVSSANIIAARTPDTQQELLNMMSSVLKTTMQHQLTVLRSVSAAEDAYEGRFAAYLRTRQMTPGESEAPPISEATLLAVDVLKALQQQRGVPLAGGLTASAPPLSDFRSSSRGPSRPVFSQTNGPSPTDPGQQEAKEFSRPSTPVNVQETRYATHDLLTDFWRRDTALLSCQRYGEALVRAANGEALEEGRSFLATQSGDAHTGLQQPPPLPTSRAVVSEAPPPCRDVPPPHLFHEEEEPPHLTSTHISVSASARVGEEALDASEDTSATHSTPTALSGSQEESAGDQQEPQVDAVASLLTSSAAISVAPHSLLSPAASPLPPPSSLPHTAETEASASASSTVASASFPAAVVDAESELEEVAASDATSPPNPMHKETLFESDCSASIVETAPVVPSPTDADGSRKAAKLFKTTFQLPATTTSVHQRRIIYLPFYRGQCTYKGVATTFYVDAQTGAVSVNPQFLAAGGRRQYALELLSSPLFFIVFNSALSILLHKRYQLEILYK